MVINKAINLVWNKKIRILSWLDQAAFLITMQASAEPWDMTLSYLDDTC